MVTTLGDIEILQVNPEPVTSRISDLTLEIEFGDPGTKATILIRHAQSMPNTRTNIQRDVRLAEALQNSASKPATIAALMAICERRNDRPAASAHSVSGGWRAERSCCLARNAAAWRQGEEDRERAIASKGRRAQRAYCGA